MTRLFELPVGKNHAFLLALQNQGFTLEQAEDVINNPSKAKLVVNALQPTLSAPSFTHFDHLLHSLDDQKSILQLRNSESEIFNEPGLQIPWSWLRELDTKSDHVESVEDLEFFFVVLNTLEDTWNFNQKLIELAQPHIVRSRISRPDFALDETQMRLDPSAVVYKPGIHRVRINLVDNWLPNGASSVNQVRLRASDGGKKLAGIEAIGAYGLQDPRLLHWQDGARLPYCSLAGLQQGDDFADTPSFNWIDNQCVVHFMSFESDYVAQRYAFPSLREY